jgi:hypothetical protein
VREHLSDRRAVDALHVESIGLKASANILEAKLNQTQSSKMEEIILDRDRIQVIINELTKALEVPTHYQFKLSFQSDPDTRKKLLIITPHSAPVEIVL